MAGAAGYGYHNQPVNCGHSATVHVSSCRQLGTAALQALAGRLEAPQSLEQAAAKLLGVLSGKAEGKLKSAYERVGVAGGLQALADGAATFSDLGNLATSTSESLCNLYK